MPIEIPRCLADLESALRHRVPLCFEPWFDLNKPIDGAIARGLRAFSSALVSNYRKPTKPPSIRRLVREHLDTPIDKFFCRHNPPEFRLLPMSKYVARGPNAACIAMRAVWQLTVGFSIDSVMTESTLNALYGAFEFLKLIQPQSELVPSENYEFSFDRTESRAVGTYERCERCARWSERYAKSIAVKGKWNGFTLELHSPLPRKVRRYGRRRFCSECKSTAPETSAGSGVRLDAQYQAAFKRATIFKKLNGPCTRELMHKHGADATVDTCSRVAGFLSRSQSAKSDVAVLVSKLKKNSSKAHRLVEEFFGVPLPDGVGLCDGSVSSILLGHKVGLIIQDAGTGKLRNFDLEVGGEIASQAIRRAISWTKLPVSVRKMPSTICLDAPELGVMLQADAPDRNGEFWSINAFVDRAENYEWIPKHLTELRSTRARASKRV